MLRSSVRAAQPRGAYLPCLPRQKTSAGRPTFKAVAADLGRSICCALRVAWSSPGPDCRNPRPQIESLISGVRLLNLHYGAL